jgi:hypothetical protein
MAATSRHAAMPPLHLCDRLRVAPLLGLGDGGGCPRSPNRDGPKAFITAAFKILAQCAARDGGNPPRSGAPIRLRVRSTELVDAFHAAALANGGVSDARP